MGVKSLGLFPFPITSMPSSDIHCAWLSPRVALACSSGSGT